MVPRCLLEKKEEVNNSLDTNLYLYLSNNFKGKSNFKMLTKGGKVFPSDLRKLFC